MFPMAMAAALMLASADAPGPRGSLPPDTTETPSPRVVRRLEEIVVRASPLHDPLSSESVQLISREAFRDLPVDRLVDAIALKAGVVAVGEQLHVRGGRAGEMQLLLRGIPLNEALRGRPMELPLLALESAELVSGGLDAEYGGALAGVVRVDTPSPGRSYEAEARWEGDSGLGWDLARATRYRRVMGRASGPLFMGLGAVTAGDVLMDDTYLPALRSRRSSNSWRADNRLLGFLKLSPVGEGGHAALEVFGSRRVDRPYSPMWSLDGYTTTCTGYFCSGGPAFSAEEMPGYERYRAADHEAMTDERRLAAVLSAWRPLGDGRLRGAAAWVASDRLTSVGGRDDESYLALIRGPIFGLPDSPTSDPIYVYHGDEPLFRKSSARTFSLRGDFDRALAGGSRYGFGAGLSYDEVRMRELDVSSRGTGLDSLRAYDAFAPGGFGYAQGRWVHQGLVLNGGLRLEYFTPGPQADQQSFAGPTHAWWSLTPRLGVAYPVSVRDVFSLAYVRIIQDPGRDFLYENRELIGHRQPLGNPALEPATVISFQAALKHLMDGGRALQAAVFYRDLFGLVGAREFDPGRGLSRPRYENADEGHAQGIELGALWPVGETFRLEVQYAFLHAVGTQSLEEGIPFGGRVTPRTASLGDYPLDWDRRHSIALSGVWRTPRAPPRAHAIQGPIELLLAGLRGGWTVSWSTRVGSGLPWTASPRRAELTDLSRVNAERFGWEENTSLAMRWMPSLSTRRLVVGLDVRNLFDFRSERAATLDGYPHPTINTYYDDYGAFRGETGLLGGAYWDSKDYDVPDAWVRVHDPRLFNPPRLVRMSLGLRW